MVDVHVNKKSVKRIAPKKVVSTKKVKLIKLDPNIIITDVLKRQWTLGKLLGQGGFGQVYETFCEQNNSKVLDKFSCEFAMKIEPSTNGPLFTEIAFYQRVCLKDKIDRYVQENKLTYLALPYYVSSGTATINSNNYRFLIFPKLGVDVETIWKNIGQKFSFKTICHIGVKMVDALAYIHSFGYTHGDVKGSNILCDFNLPNLSGKIYLTDFGLTSLYVDSITTLKHKQYKEIPKQKHNGTIELTCCDAHSGVVVSRRGDMEIIGYMLLRFFASKLPWESYMNDPNKVAEMKFKFRDNLSSELNKIINPKSTREKVFFQTMKQYFNMIYGLKYEEQPNYSKLKACLRKMITVKAYKSLHDEVFFENC